MSKEVLVIGGGIAGACTAYFLSQAGAAVTVIDAGLHAASSVPSALINPVRGQSGQVDTNALAGMHLTWQLIAQLIGAGYVIPHDQSGVLRPVPSEKARAKFEKNLPPQLQQEWTEPPPLLAAGWAAALRLPEGGWVDGQALRRALLEASGARLIKGKAVNWTAQSVTVLTNDSYDHPEKYDADAVIFCGGSLGVTWANEAATHRMGSMLLLARAVSDVPVSFGAYLTPSARGGVLGATFEAPASAWQPPNLPLSSLSWLMQKGQALAELSGTQVTGRWTGSRLSGLQCGQESSGVWRLSGLSSKGFLLGPLLAAQLAEQLLSRSTSQAQ